MLPAVPSDDVAPGFADRQRSSTLGAGPKLVEARRAADFGPAASVRATFDPAASPAELRACSAAVLGDSTVPVRCVLAGNAGALVAAL